MQKATRKGKRNIRTGGGWAALVLRLSAGPAIDIKCQEAEVVPGTAESVWGSSAAWTWFFLQLPLPYARGKLCSVPAIPGQLVRSSQPSQAGNQAAATRDQPWESQHLRLQVSSSQGGRAGSSPCTAKGTLLQHPGVYRRIPAGCTILAPPFLLLFLPRSPLCCKCWVLTATSPCSSRHRGRLLDHLTQARNQMGTFSGLPEGLHRDFSVVTSPCPCATWC